MLEEQWTGWQEMPKAMVNLVALMAWSMAIWAIHQAHTECIFDNSVAMVQKATWLWLTETKNLIFAKWAVAWKRGTEDAFSQAWAQLETALQHLEQGL